MLCSSALSPPFPSLPSHPPTWPERECMCTCMCMCLFSLRSVDYVMECAGYIAACIYSLIHALDIWSKTCGLSPDGTSPQNRVLADRSDRDLYKERSSLLASLDAEVRC